MGYHALRKTVTCDTFSEEKLYILSQSKEGNQEKFAKLLPGRMFSISQMSNDELVQSLPWRENICEANGQVPPC